MKWLQFLPRLFKAGNAVQEKGWYASATIWFNLLVLCADIVLKFHPDLLGVTLDEESLNSIALGIAAVGNLVLRARTATPLGLHTVHRPDDSAYQPTGAHK